MHTYCLCSVHCEWILLFIFFFFEYKVLVHLNRIPWIEWTAGIGLRMYHARLGLRWWFVLLLLTYLFFPLYFRVQSPCVPIPDDLDGADS